MQETVLCCFNDVWAMTSRMAPVFPLFRPTYKLFVRRVRQADERGGWVMMPQIEYTMAL